MKPTISKKPDRQARLYHTDETAWLELCANLIQKRRYLELDYDNLKEYLRDMAERDKREVRSRLLQLMLHLLKWQYQPKRRTHSWKNSILSQREELEDILGSKSLANHAVERLADVYAKAVKRAIREARLEQSVFPEECPYSLEYLLGEDFPA
jgi:hypothetical protein